MTVRKLFFIAIGVLAGFSAAGSLVHPFGPTETPSSPGQLLQGTRIDPATFAILERSCQNCHSERTVWPWYAHVAPASWMIARDVELARRQLNLSQWQRYAGEDRVQLLSAIGAAVRSGEMPPRRYVLIHPEARLTADERERVYQWTRAERVRTRIMGKTSPTQLNITPAGMNRPALENRFILRSLSSPKPPTSTPPRSDSSSDSSSLSDGAITGLFEAAFLEPVDSAKSRSMSRIRKTY